MSGELMSTVLIVILWISLLWLAAKLQGLRERVETLEDRVEGLMRATGN